MRRVLLTFLISILALCNLFAAIRSTTSYLKNGVPSSGVSNVTWDSSNNYAVFDGNSSYLSIENPFKDFSIKEGLTIKMDVYIESSGQALYARLFDICDNKTKIEESSHFCLFGGTEFTGGFMFCAGDQSSKTSSEKLDADILDKWITYEFVIGPGGYCTVYVDGVADKHSSPTNYITTVLNNLKDYTRCYIGESIYHVICDNPDGFFKGKMKNVELSLGTNRPVLDDDGSILYTVNFNSNGGSVIDDLAKKTLPDVDTLYVPTKAGSQFLGWYTDSELKNKAVANSALSTETDLYAKWRPDPRYVSANGNDTTGDGTFAKPYATITKAYSSLSSAGGAIVLLSDININSTLSVSGSKNVLITSGNTQNGDFLENEEGNYAGVFSIHRRSFSGNMMELSNANLTLKQVIIDCDETVVSSFLIQVNSSNPSGILTLDTNSVLKDNIATGNGGGTQGSCIRLGTLDGSTKPKMYMKSNAAIYGCIAPRHGGALTIYDGDAYIQDNATMQYNGVVYNSNYGEHLYYGGGAVLAYGGDLYLSGNASIINNYIQLNGGDDGGKQHNAMQIDPAMSSSVYIRGNVKIFDNFDDGKLTYNSDGTYTLEGSIRANAYAKAGSFKINGAMGSEARIGVTIYNASVNTSVIKNSEYSLVDSDADAFFEDSGTYSFYRDANDIKLSSSVTEVSLVVNSLSNKVLSGTFDTAVAFTARDFSVFKNGVKMTDGYSVSVVGKNLSIVFDSALAVNTKIGVAVSKNGYKVNKGNIVEAVCKHDHKWVYVVEDNKLSAYCVSYDFDCGMCSYLGENHSVSLSLVPKWTTVLEAEVFPEDASSKDVVWSSSDSEVLTVDSNGSIEGLKAGVATVFATASDGSGKFAACEVTLL